MKHLKLAALLALIIGCSPQEHLEVKAIDILPPGGDVDSITAYVDLQGTGIARLDWERRAYGVDSLMQSEYWYVDSSDVYTSTLSVTDGWYWLSIYDEDSVLLTTSDVVFCGTGSQLPPIAKFYAEPTSGEAPLQVEFYDQSLNDPTSWFLDYGDGESAEYLGSHRYEEVGSYDVTLTVSNLAGVDTLTKKNYIQVERPDPPEINLMALPTKGPVPFDVTFYCLYERPPSQQSWLYTFKLFLGNGDSISDCSREYYSHDYTYNTPGIYTVTMILIDKYDQADTAIREDYIHVEETPYTPMADFYAHPSTGKNPLGVHFSNLSRTEWHPAQPYCQWDFGDGTDTTTRGLDGLYHLYQKEGTFTVTLIIQDADGVDTLTQKDYIHVTEP